jgi:tRNA-specific 2-thiouridylase
MQKSKSETTVIIGMSGGVDSSVCAALLKDEGYKVIGLFMKNWEEFDEHGVCQSSKEYADVEKVCEKIGIPCYSIDFIKEYRENVFDQFIKEYENGYTPNPDVLCNREIKFKVFFEKAMGLGADYLATGHYCQVKNINGRTQLLKGADPKKDQSYFLCAVKSEVLEKVMFPIGHIPKSKVRELAAHYDLATKNKKDSTGICFIGERNFKNFLSHYVTFTAGNFVNLKGEIVGIHTGSNYYTIGQRKGLGLGGQGEPWFVVGKNTAKNEVIVERGEFHPALYSYTLTANEISFVDDHIVLNYPFKCTAKIRYRQVDQGCTILKNDNGTFHVQFDIPQRAITPRQSIVFYNNNVCIGGAMIIDRGASLFESNLEVPAELKATSNTSDH